MAKGRLPRLTHLQFLVLGQLLDGEQPGRTLRAALGAHGVRRTAAAFYQLMARLERDGLIDGWYDQTLVGDQAVTERRYRIRAAGARRWTEARDFYAALIDPAARQRWSDA